MEEEGDLVILVLATMEYERERKYLKFCSVAYPFKEEGVFIVSPEK